MPCDQYGGSGRLIVLDEELKPWADPVEPSALIKTKEIPCPRCVFSELGNAINNLREPVEKITKTFQEFSQNMTYVEWSEMEQLVGKQDYPTDPDEVCCLCHEEIATGYPPEAFIRNQAPYTYVPDLQGWAHDTCAKEYFHPQTLSPDLKPSRTERLP